MVLLVVAKQKSMAPLMLLPLSDMTDLCLFYVLAALENKLICYGAEFSNALLKLLLLYNNILSKLMFNFVIGGPAKGVHPFQKICSFPSSRISKVTLTPLAGIAP